MDNFESQEFIDKQFNKLRAILCNIVELVEKDDEKCELLKKEIKSSTSQIWDNFSTSLGTRKRG